MIRRFLTAFIVGTLASGCGSTSTSGHVLNPIERLPGYTHTFAYPRTDVPPGTVVIVWDSGQIDVVCRADEYDPTGAVTQTTPSPPIDISEAKKRELKARVTADVTDAVNASLGANSSSSVDATMNFTPLSLTNPTAALMAATSSDVCRERTAFLRELHGKDLQRIDILTEVAVFTFDFTIKTKTAIDASIDLNILGAKVAGSISKVDDTTIKISGQKTYTNYNRGKTPLLLTDTTQTHCEKSPDAGAVPGEREFVLNCRMRPGALVTVSLKGTRGMGDNFIFPDCGTLGGCDKATYSIKTSLTALEFSAKPECSGSALVPCTLQAQGAVTVPPDGNVTAKLRVESCGFGQAKRCDLSFLTLGISQ